MSTTRPALARKVTRAAAVPALLLAFAACGDDDDESASAFCDTAVEIDERFANEDIADPDALAEITAMMADVEPPNELADDWETLVAAYQAIGEIDLEDPDAIAEVEADPRFENIDEAADNIETYIEEECRAE